MNPIHWIRWKVLAGLTLVVGGLSYFGVNPLVTHQINELGDGRLGLSWGVQSFRLDLARGSIDLNGVTVATLATQAGVAPTPEQVFAAQAAHFDIDMAELLRRRVHGEVRVQAPKLIIHRHADGSFNVADAEPADDGFGLGSVDWLKLLDKCLEYAERLDQQRRRIAKRMPDWEPGDQTEPPATQPPIDYARRVTYPFDHVPRFVATRIIGEGLEVEFVDDGSDGERDLPRLTNGQIVIENLSDRPECCAEPIRWTIAGDIDGSPVRFAGTLDRRVLAEASTVAARKDLDFDFAADRLPIALVRLFVGNSLPVRFDQGTVKLAAVGSVAQSGRVDIRPSFSFRDAVVSPRPRAKGIAGVDPAIFCRAFNEVGTFELSDIRVKGTLSDPRVDLGSTLKDLVREGSRAIARKQLDRGIEKGTEKLREFADEELEKIGGAKAVEGVTGKLDDNLGGAVRGALKALPFGERDKPTTKTPVRR